MIRWGRRGEVGEPDGSLEPRLPLWVKAQLLRGNGPGVLGGGAPALLPEWRNVALTSRMPLLLSSLSSGSTFPVRKV